jgi:hypothetical protein
VSSHIKYVDVGRVLFKATVAWSLVKAHDSRDVVKFEHVHIQWHED